MFLVLKIGQMQIVPEETNGEQGSSRITSHRVKKVATLFLIDDHCVYEYRQFLELSL